MSEDYEVVWQALPGSQELALTAPADEILYCGTRGPGKSECQLARFRMRVGMGYGSFWRGVIFDREYKNLDDLVVKSKRMFNKLEDGSRFLESGKDYKWVWPTGEELLFRAIKKDADYWNFHGQEFPFIGWNELTKYPTPDLYNALLSCNRSSFMSDEIAPIPLEIFSTTNSKGPGRTWVKRLFIDGTTYGKIQKERRIVFNPRTKKDEEITIKRVCIFGSYKENSFLDPKYVASLYKACENDENKRKSWLEGSWEIQEGGIFSELWNTKVHIIDRFPIPQNWRVDRSMDWGESSPFSIQWWAEANGEEVILPNGKTWCPQKGSLINFSEWYGAREEDVGFNRGLNLGAIDVADGINRKEQTLIEAGWIKNKPNPGPADNSISQPVPSIDKDSVQKWMATRNVLWAKSDKSAGSRKIGVQIFKDRLRASLKGEGPGIYFMRNCKVAIHLLPELPADPDDLDDVDTTCEEHIWDSTRYRVLAGNDRYASKINVKFL